MSHPARSRSLVGLGGVLRLLSALRRPFRGQASGAAFIEYLLVCGTIALCAILAFKDFGRRTDQTVKDQAEVVRTLYAPAPRPGSVLRPGPASGGLFGSIAGIAPPLAGAAPPGKFRLPVIQPQCFAAGTPVLAEHGERAIEAIQVGEHVWARDEATGEDQLARVVQTFVTRDALVIGVDVPFDVGRSERLFVTPEHPFWVRDFGWVAAQELHGSLLERRAAWLLTSAAPGAQPPPPSASAVEAWGERTSVYNLEVEGLHTYFVGRAGVLVHNACGLAVKSYTEWLADPKQPPNTEVNHLNQDKVFGTANKQGGRIPRGRGVSVPMTGSTNPRDRDSEHYKFHRSLENFWDLYRENGPYAEDLPTNAEYIKAVERALLDAGFSKADAKRMAKAAQEQLREFDYEDDADVPRIPGPFM